MDRNDPMETATYNQHAAEDDACERCGMPGSRECQTCHQWLCQACMAWPLCECDECFGAKIEEEDEE